MESIVAQICRCTVSSGHLIKYPGNTGQGHKGITEVMIEEYYDQVEALASPFSFEPV